MVFDQLPAIIERRGSNKNDVLASGMKAVIGNVALNVSHVRTPDLGTSRSECLVSAGREGV